MRYLAFIDRDGCLIEEPQDEQVDRIDKIRLATGVIPALLRITKEGYRLIMVTNQDGLGTDSFPQADFEAAQNFLLELFSSQGIEFDEILICPHKPEDQCSCRKPETGLVEGYLKKDDWSRERAFFAGDRESDMILAKRMGIKGYQISSSFGWEDLVHDLLDQPRVAYVERITKETAIKVRCDLDGRGRAQVATGIGFFDHMLDSFARHSGIDLTLSCKGDLQVDEHHSMEDVGLCLGQAIEKALGKKVGITRFGAMLPMDETLVQVALDLSGRPFFSFNGQLTRERVGELPTEMVTHFFRSLSDALRCNLHITVSGENDHHQIEAMFKGVGRALAQAIAKTGEGLPSTKGVL